MITLKYESQEYKFSLAKKLSNHIKKTVHKYAISLLVNSDSFIVCYVNDKRRAADALLALIRAFSPASRKLSDTIQVVLASKHEEYINYELPICNDDPVTKQIESFIKYN